MNRTKMPESLEEFLASTQHLKSPSFNGDLHEIAKAMELSPDLLVMLQDLINRCFEQGYAACLTEHIRSDLLAMKNLKENNVHV